MFLQHGLDPHLFWVVGVFASGQVVEGYFVTPRIVGSSLGLHPMAIVLGLVAGGRLLEFFRMVLAVPLLAVARVLLWPVLSALLRGEPPLGALAQIDTQELN